MNNNVKGLDPYQPYIVSLVPYISIFLLLRLIVGDEWQWGEFFLLIAILFAWSLFKTITRAIYFRLFLKKKLVDSYVSMFEENKFPIPDVDDIESFGIYLESIAENKDLHPQNIGAATVWYELNHGRSANNIFSLFSHRKTLKKALRIYRQKHKLKGGFFNSHEE